MTGARRQRLAEGAVVLVPLGDGTAAFGRCLVEPTVEFFDLRVAEDAVPEVAEVVGHPVLFTVWVMNSAITSGRWRKIGKAPLTTEERSRPEVRFRQDRISKTFSLYTTQGGVVTERPAGFSEVEGFELAAVWSAEHVEDRLRDHFDGLPNKWVEMQKPKRDR